MTSTRAQSDGDDRRPSQRAKILNRTANTHTEAKTVKDLPATSGAGRVASALAMMRMHNVKRALV